MSQRRNHTATFKSAVALEAIRGELTLAELASKHGIHQTLITKWKRQALEGLSDIFSDKAAKSEVDHEDTIKELHAKIGQLTVERDFLERASSHLTGKRGKK